MLETRVVEVTLFETGAPTELIDSERPLGGPNAATEGDPSLTLPTPAAELEAPELAAAQLASAGLLGEIFGSTMSSGCICCKRWVLV